MQSPCDLGKQHGKQQGKQQAKPLWEVVPHESLCPAYLHGAEVAPHVAYDAVPTAINEAFRSRSVGFALLNKKLIFQNDSDAGIQTP